MVNVETLMAHSTGISDHYYRPTEHDLLKDYLKAVNNLTIDNTRQMVIKEVSENQQALAAQMECKDKEIQELRDQMAMMEESQLKITELKIIEFKNSKVTGRKDRGEEGGQYLMKNAERLLGTSPIITSA
jgi:hypothetical protein